MKKIFSIVIPVYKNESNLPWTIPLILEKMPVLIPNYQIELILVNDGSPDRSWEVMKEFHQKYPESIYIASFTNNFGQYMAIRYGVSIAHGDAIGVISADLQDPIEVFADMLSAIEEGYDIVCGVRKKREDEGIGIIFSKITHWMINHFITSQYPIGGFDFFAMSRTIANQLSEIQERNGSLQLLLLWISSSVKFLPYTRQKRELGKSGWTFSKKVTYFIDIFVTNSYLPMRIMSVSGFLFSGFAFLYSIIIFVEVLVMGRDVPGWSSIALMITFFSGLILASLGIIGEYLWRIHDAVKGRPLYIVKESISNIFNPEGS